MTEHNRIPARQIIVYGDCWPVTIAVAHLVRRFLPSCNCETAYSAAKHLIPICISFDTDKK